MKLAKALSRETIVEELAARDRHGALGELAERLATAGAVPGAGADELLARLEERERLESTGIGDGVAIPHARLGALPGVILAVARSREGLEYAARDGLPVHLLFLLVSPEHAAGEHLCALARISRLARQPDFRRSLLAAPSREEMLDIIAREDSRN